MENTINVKGRLMSFSVPKVMGIMNVTPDSFYASSRQQSEQDVAERCNQIVAEGGDIIDVGACSTRPGAEVPSEAEEMERLRRALTVVRREQPEVVVSVDTFRPDVARMAVEEYGADIINDVGAVAFQFSAHDSKNSILKMFRMVSRLRVPYVLTSHCATLEEVLLGFARDVQQLRDMGQNDIILDPGFGFGKTMEQNYQLMAELEKLSVMQLPLLVGVSRKSMIQKLLGCTAEESLCGTIALNTFALMHGASILRVHDVRQAVECIRIVTSLTHQE